MAQCRSGQGKACHLQTDKAVLPCVQRRIGSGSNVTLGWLGEVHEPVTAIRWCGTLCCSAGHRSGTAGLRILLLPDERSGPGRHRGPSLIAARDQWPRRSFLHQLQSRSFQVVYPRTSNLVSLPLPARVVTRPTPTAGALPTGHGRGPKVLRSVASVLGAPPARLLFCPWTLAPGGTTLDYDSG